MKMGKRFCTGLLAVMMVLCIAGCSKKNPDSGDGDEYTPTSSLALSEEEAAALSGKMRVKLYYTAPENTQLAGEIHLLEYTAKDAKAEHLIQKVMESLLAGPSEGGKLGVLIPEGAKVENVSIKDDCATIDFNRAFADGLPKEKETAKLLAYSIVNTVTELKEIEKVKITVEGGDIGVTDSGFEFTTFSRSLEMVAAANSTEDVFSESDYDGVELE